MIKEIRNVKRFEFLAETFVRNKKSNISGLNPESLRDILYRISKESDEYLDLDEFLEFFTQNGRPISFQTFDPEEKKRSLNKKIQNFFSQKKSLNSPKKNPKYHTSSKQSSAKGRELNSPSKLRMNSQNSERRLNSEESYKNTFSSYHKSQNRSNSPKKREFSQEIEKHDPDLIVTKRRYSNSPIENKKNSYHKEKKPKEFDFYNENKDEKIRVIDGYDSDPEYNNFNLRNEPKQTKKIRNLSFSGEKNKKKDNLKITVPFPFQFDEREKLKKMEKLLDDFPKKKENIKTFKANPVPEFVKQRNLLEQINKEQEIRREEVKKNSKIITMQREKPFSFYNRDTQKIRKKNLYERKQFQFKANPVPWFCSIKLLERMNEEERAKREERVAKHAQITLNMSKLPPRMEKHEQEKVNLDHLKNN